MPWVAKFQPRILVSPTAIFHRRFFEKSVVAGIPAKIDLGVSVADGITGPQGLVSIEQAPGRKMDRRDGGHCDGGDQGSSEKYTLIHISFNSLSNNRR